MVCGITFNSVTALLNKMKNFLARLQIEIMTFIWLQKDYV